MVRRQVVFQRTLLFVLTNLAVLALFTAVLWLLRATGVLGPTVFGREAWGLLAFAALFGFGGAFVSLMLSRRMAVWSTGARVIGAPHTEGEAWLVDTVRQLAKASGVSMPEVAIYPSRAMNAFATGARRNSALLAVSTGLLAGMDRDQIRAVLGHEMSHVANGDMVTLALLQGVLNTFVLFFSRLVGVFVDRALFRNERGLGVGYLLSTIALQLAFGMLASLVVLAFSRRREFRADRGSAELAGAPPMISALRRLEKDAQPVELDASLLDFGIQGEHLDVRARLARLFATHPPLSERIARLQRFESGTDSNNL